MANLSIDPQKYNFFQTDIRGQNLELPSVRSQLPFLERSGGAAPGQAQAPGQGKGQAQANKKIAKKVKQMFAKIQKRGEAAVVGFAKKYDGADSADFRIPPEKIAASLEQIPPELLKAIKLADSRIRKYYETQASAQIVESSQTGEINITTKTLPLESAGIYVPGGNTSGTTKYPSSVLMNVIPAQVAGVKRIILCTPPNSTNSTTSTVREVSNEVLAAACVAGVDEVYGIGGVQAIAAMAYGYRLPKVDIICGPGNEFVAEAQKIVSSQGSVRVPPAFAGPSEIAIIADKDTEPTFSALDILAQMEHGVGGWAWIISWDKKILEQINAQINSVLQSAEVPSVDGKSADTKSTNIKPPDIYAVLVDDPDQAIELTNLSAPEHLQAPQELASQIKNAGAVFCGNNTATALGDYIAGPSHTLPTGGSAKFAGALGVSDFQKTINIMSSDVSSTDDLLKAAITLAEAEGFKMHAESLRARLNKNRNKNPKNKP